MDVIPGEICPSCRRIIPENSLYCPKCGKETKNKLISKIVKWFGIAIEIVLVPLAILGIFKIVEIVIELIK